MKNKPLLSFPEKGIDQDKLIEVINKFKSTDATWDKGKMFGFVYHPEDKIAKVIQQVFNLYFFENAVNPALFGSIVHFENETVSMVADLLHGDDQVSGNVTSGGTESILMALKVAREKAKQEKPGIKDYEVIIPETAHPAFKSSIWYFL